MPSDPNTEILMSVALLVHTTLSPVDMVNRGLSNVSSNGSSAFNTIDTVGADVEVDTNILMKAFVSVLRLVITAQAITPSVVPFVYATALPVDVPASPVEVASSWPSIFQVGIRLGYLPG